MIIGEENDSQCISRTRGPHLHRNQSFEVVESALI